MSDSKTLMNFTHKLRPRTADGEMFVVKDPERFAAQVIPQYFDHNKFSSFARQLNFYGFRKMQSKPIKNADYDEAAAKYVTFFNENFKRGRCDLLKNIQRSTRGGTSSTSQDTQRELQQLRDQVQFLEQKISDMNLQMEERVRRLEMDLLARMETMGGGNQNALNLQHVQSIGSVANDWDQNTLNQFMRGASIASLGVQSVQNNTMAYPPQQMPLSREPSQTVSAMEPPKNVTMAPPTLPPHPKQKSLPSMGLPAQNGAPSARMESLRGLSFGLARGQSVESTTSAVLMKNSYDDNIFSMLMMGDENQTLDRALAETKVPTVSTSTIGSEAGVVPPAQNMQVEL